MNLTRVTFRNLSKHAVQVAIVVQLLFFWLAAPAAAQPRITVNTPEMPVLATEADISRDVNLDSFELKQYGFLPGELDDDDHDGVPNIDDLCPDTEHEAAHGRAKYTGLDDCGCAITLEPLPEAEIQRRLATLITADTINFEFDKSRLTLNALVLLNDYLARVEGRPLSVLVEGHADSIGSAAYNQRLSERRAATVSKWLEARGVNTELVQTVGFGESKPLLPGDSFANRMQNRRVELSIRTEVDSESAAFKLPIYADPSNFLQIDCAESTVGLNANGQRILNKLAAYLIPNPDARLSVAGFVNDPKLSDENREKVARARAQAARKYLIEIGVPPYQLETVESAGTGQTDSQSCVVMVLQN